MGVRDSTAPSVSRIGEAGVVENDAQRRRLGRDATTAAIPDAAETELAAIHGEIAALRELLAALDHDPQGSP
jgi:hypothetical protein